MRPGRAPLPALYAGVIALAATIFFAASRPATAVAQPGPSRGVGGAATLSVAEIIASSDGLVRPSDITHAGDDRLFIVEKPGRIRVYKNGALLATPYLDIVSRVDDDSNEEGLLGLAFDPNYATNGYFYVNYIHTDASNDRRTRISRFTVSANPDVANPASESILLTVDQPNSNHNAGDLNFGLDGYLYIPLGDGGGQNDSANNAQELDKLLGKVVRIDVHSGPGNAPDCVGLGNGAYTVPADNPLNNGAGAPCDEIWSIGLRNPWRSSFDRDTGDFWLADVGQDAWEEVSVQTADSSGGENWGWRCYEGNAAHNLTGCQPPGAYTFPVFAYSHTLPGICAVTGGFVYRGTDAALQPLQGHYLLADYCREDFWSLHLTIGGTYSVTTYASVTISPSVSLNAISTFGEGEDGSLYLAEDASGGSVFKVTGVSLPCAAAAPSAPVVAVSAAGDDMVLSWTDHAANSGGYEIHRDADPTFTPSAGTLLTTLSPGATGYTDVAVLAGATDSHTYVVRGLNCDGSRGADSGRTAFARFSLLPGAP